MLYPYPPGKGERAGPGPARPKAQFNPAVPVFRTSQLFIIYKVSVLATPNGFWPLGRAVGRAVIT
jgi:hypothetical protein